MDIHLTSHNSEMKTFQADEHSQDCI